MSTPASSGKTLRGSSSSTKDIVLSNTKTILHYFSPASSATPQRSLVKHPQQQEQQQEQQEEEAKDVKPSIGCSDDGIKERTESHVVKRLFDENKSSNLGEADIGRKKQRCDSKPLTDSYMEEKDCNHDDYNGTNSKVQLGLVRVDCPGIKLDELTDFLSSIENKSHNNTIYPLFSGAILGRGEQSSSSSSAFKGTVHRKVNIGISKSENGVSRKQVKVESIYMHSNNKDQNQKKEQKRLLHSVKSQMQYINDIQSYSPTIKISCASDAVNPILVCKVRCNSIYLSGKEKFRGVPLRNQVDLLYMGNSVELKVGDAIEFDLYNRAKEEGVTTKYLSARSSGKYVYRIVAYEPDVIRMESNTGKQGTANDSAIVLDHDDINLNSVPVENICEKSSSDAVMVTEVDTFEDHVASSSQVKPNSSSLFEPIQSVQHLEKLGNISNQSIITSDEVSATDADHQMIERCMKITPTTTPKSDGQPSLADHTVKKPPVYIPQVGDLFRVGMIDKDLFTSKKSMKWYIGTATTVRLKKDHSNRYIIGFKFNDSQSCTEEYPHKCVMPIVKRTNSIYEIAHHGSLNGMFALDNDPKQLFLGDLVECRFQDGALNGHWWYGRVAAIHDESKTVDVAYFDQNYEKNVPLSSDNIRLIQRGTFKTAEWMLDAKLLTKNGSLPMKVINILAPNNASPEFDMSQSVKVVISSGRGQNKTEQTITYQEAARMLFSNLLQMLIDEEQRTGDTLVLKWPISNKLMSKSEKKKFMEQVQKVQAEETVISGITSQALQRLTNVVDFSQDSNVSVDDDEKFTRTSVASELSPILANTFWRYLNSAEPHIGHGYLVNELIHSNKIPNKLLSERLYDFILNGPMVDNTKFSEPQRTYLVFDYIQRLKTKIQVEEIQNAHPIAPTNFGQLESLLKLPLDMAEKVTPLTICKTMTEDCSLGLYHACRAISFAESSIQNEMQSMISCDFEFDANLLTGMHFVSKMLAVDTRKLLQNVTDIVIKTWLCHGHWILGFVGEANRSLKTVNEIKCSVETYDILKALGRILCHVAWLYCAIESKPFPDYSCCYIIRDVVMRELELFDYNEFCLEGKVDEAMKIQFSKEITLRFVLSLESPFAKSLLVRVGEVLKMDEEISMILG